MVRREFKDIPSVDAFIACQVWRYIGKTVQDNENSIPKKMLGAWIKATKKQGQPQMSSKNNHANTLNEILKNRIPNIDNRGIFKEWTSLAQCEDTWETLADKYFRKLQPKTRPIPVNTDAENIMSLNHMISTSFDQFLSENPDFRMRGKEPTCAHPLADGYPQPFITLQDNNTK